MTALEEYNERGRTFVHGTAVREYADAMRDELLAELAALKARRCENCAGRSRGDWNLGDFCGNESSCAFGCLVDADFSCSRWQSREESS